MYLLVSCWQIDRHEVFLITERCPRTDRRAVDTQRFAQIENVRTFRLVRCITLRYNTRVCVRIILYITRFKTGWERDTRTYTAGRLTGDLLPEAGRKKYLLR